MTVEQTVWTSLFSSVRFVLSNTLEKRGFDRACKTVEQTVWTSLFSSFRIVLSNTWEKRGFNSACMTVEQTVVVLPNTWEKREFIQLKFAQSGTCYQASYK